MKRSGLFLLILLLFVAPCLVTNGQQDTVGPGKLVNVSPATIDLGEIPIRSAQLQSKTKREMGDLISTEAISQLRVNNIIILSNIDSGLLNSVGQNDSIHNLRYLENREIRILQEKRRIDDHKTELTNVFQRLNDFNNHIILEKRQWENTKKILERDSLTIYLPEQLTETIQFLDSVQNLISARSKPILEILNKTIDVGVDIDLQYEKIKAFIESKEQNVLHPDHPTFFNLHFNHNIIDEIKESFSNKQAAVVELQKYLASHSNLVLLSVILLLCFYSFFRFIRKNSKLLKKGKDSQAKVVLGKIIEHPVSSSILLVIFCTYFLFPDKPFSFTEFIGYLISIPLLMLLDELMLKENKKYFFLFLVLTFLYVVKVVIYSETLIFRLMLLLISITEIGLFLYILEPFVHKRQGKRPGRTFFFSMLFLVLALVGFFSNIFGCVILSELALTSVFANIFTLLIIYISILLTKSLIVTTIDYLEIHNFNVLRLYGESIKRRALFWIDVFGILYWFVFFFKSFFVKDLIFDRIRAIFSYQITVGSAHFTLNAILLFVVVIYFSIMLSQLIQYVLELDILNRMELSKGAPHSISMVVKYSLVTFGFFLAIAATGIPFDKMTVILGAFSVGIGFGLQSIFNNLVSGLILLIERPIQLGDTIKVGQLTGNVKSIGLRASNVRTFEGAEVIVPNGQLVSNEVINWTLSDQKRRMEINVGVAYHSDPVQVQQLLLGILTNNPDICDQPEPDVFFNELGMNSLEFSLLFWIEDYNQGRMIKSQVLFKVFEELKRNQIEIPFPQQDIHLRSVDKEIKLNLFNPGPPDAGQQG